MKKLIILCYLFIPWFGISQSSSLLSEIDTISTNQARLDYIGKTINAQIYSNPESIGDYAKVFDSIAKIEVTPENTADAFNFKGVAHYVVQDYSQAIDYYLESVRILEELGKKKKLSRIYNNLAACYNVRDDFENTEKYFLKSLTISEEIKDEVWVANLKNNLSVLYMNNEMYDEANEMIENALTYYKKNNDSLWMGITYMNYGNSKVFSGNYSNAIEHYLKAKSLVKYQQLPLLFAVSETGIGTALTEQKKYKEALPHLLEGLEIGKKIKHTEQIMESYNALSEYYSKTNDYKNAYLLSQESQKLKDSVLTATQDQNMANALTKFETEKKDAQLQLMQLEAEKKEQQQQLYIYLAIAGLIISGLIGFFLIKNRKKNKLLANQKSILEATLDEKNVLLKETHHRVKNSFQIVSSLLYLQSENVTDKEGQLALKEAQNRVRSMVLIHQKLYSKEQLVGINTKEYISDLIRDILESHQDENHQLEYDLNVKNLVLSIETITPLGLILNELITNVLKHAFNPDSVSKKLSVTLKQYNEQLVLKVSDNGQGMPAKIKESSFGIQLIKSLAKKLKATLNYSENEPYGTNATLVMNRFEVL